MRRTRSVSRERKLHGAPRPVRANPDKNVVNEMEIDRILSRLQVARILGVSPTTLWRMVNRKLFPRGIRISPGRVGWRTSTVRDWLKARSNGAD